MKKINKYFYSAVLLSLFASSCDKDFDQTNVNPIALTSVEPTFQLNNAIVGSAPVYGNLSYETTIVKQMITPFSGQGSAANFNQDNRTVSNTNWTKYYRSVIRELVDVIEKTKSDPNNTNLYNTARIWRAYAFLTLTDTYGDIPYKEAGKGYLESLVKPVYDSQESIYTDILNELEVATGALDNAKTKVTREVLYAGDITKWKRFGYSLMLRAAMRLSKVKPAIAASYVTKAVAGGLMQAIDDNAVIRHTANFSNDIGNQLNGGQSAFFYLAEDFVNHLKNNNDPRLAAISVRYVGAVSGADQRETKANRTPAVQIGMPLGFDNTTIAGQVASKGLASLWDYSQLDRTRMAGSLAPSFLLTYSQTQLLLAEAVTRGWTTGDASALYANGIRAHMRQLAGYGTSVAIAEGTIDMFIMTHPLDLTKALEQINTQYWVSSFLNGPETFANFRRSGYPVLTPNLFPGKDLKTETFIRRLTYPDTELNVNFANVQLSVARQGADNMDTRMWWDVK